MLHKWFCAARISGRWQRLRPFTSGYEHVFADTFRWCDSNAVKASRRGLSSSVVVLLCAKKSHVTAFKFKRKTAVCAEKAMPSDHRQSSM